jgi:hypothetical protein
LSHHLSLILNSLQFFIKAIIAIVEVKFAFLLESLFIHTVKAIEAYIEFIEQSEVDFWVLNILWLALFYFEVLQPLPLCLY